MTSLIQCLNVGGDLSFHFINIMRLASSVANAITVLPELPMPSSSGVTHWVNIRSDPSQPCF